MFIIHGKLYKDYHMIKTDNKAIVRILYDDRLNFPQAYLNDLHSSKAIYLYI